MEKPLRLACLGDSWVSSWTEESDGEPKRIISPMPDALRSGLETRGQSVELFIAGFPGSTTERLLDLVKICRLRDMVPMSNCGCSIKGDLVTRLEANNICFSPSADDRLDEDVDKVIIAVGSNDLCDESMRQRVLGRLFTLRQLYIKRGVEVLLVSLGGVQPEEVKDSQYIDLEANRACINSRLLKEDWVLNFDDLIAGFGASLWLDSWHLTIEGCHKYGESLAAAIFAHHEKQKLKPTTMPQELSYRQEDLVRVSRCNDMIVSDVIEGVYYWDGVNHGRPVYKRQSMGGTADVVIFFWDDRNGPENAGWWFGPEIGWNHPGWAHHDDTTGPMLPTSGWKAPPDGGVDEKLKITAGASSDLEELTACLVGKASLGINASSCSNPLISNIIRGRFVSHGVNHGKPIYKKQVGDGAAEVRIFFWDARHGADWSGWWISPKVGCWTHSGWARHRDALAHMPPTHGWYIPPYGEVDEAFRLTHADEACLQSGIDNVESTPCAKGECEAMPPALHVAACQNDTVSAILSGYYFIDGTHHGRPVYTKPQRAANDMTPQVFFWDARDGPKYAGWWFGPSCGNWYRSGWAHHEDGASVLPPRVGWQVPIHGPVDEQLCVTLVNLPATCMSVAGQAPEEGLGTSKCDDEVSLEGISEPPDKLRRMA